MAGFMANYGSSALARVVGVLARVGIPVDRLLPGTSSPLSGGNLSVAELPELSPPPLQAAFPLPQCPVSSVLDLKGLLPKKVREGISDDHQFASGIWMRSMKGVRGIETREKGEVTKTDLVYMTRNRGAGWADQLVVFHGQAEGEKFSFRVEMYAGFLMYTITFQDEGGEVKPLVSTEIIETAEALTIEDILPSGRGARLFSPKLRRSMRGSAFWTGDWVARAVDDGVPHATRKNGQARYEVFDVASHRQIIFRQTGEGRDAHLVVEAYDGNAIHRFTEAGEVLDTNRYASAQTAAPQVPAARVALEVDVEPPMTYAEFLAMAEENPMSLPQSPDLSVLAEEKPIPPALPQPSALAQADFKDVQAALSRVGAWVKDIAALKKGDWLKKGSLERGMIEWLSGKPRSAKMKIGGEGVEVEEFVCTDRMAKREYHFARRKDKGEVVVQVIENPGTPEARVSFFDFEAASAQKRTQAATRSESSPRTVQVKATGASQAAAVVAADTGVVTPRQIGSLAEHLTRLQEVLTKKLGVPAEAIADQDKLLAADWLVALSAEGDKVKVEKTEADGVTYESRTVSFSDGEHGQRVDFLFIKFSDLPLYIMVYSYADGKTVFQTGQMRTIKKNTAQEKPAAALAEAEPKPAAAAGQAADTKGTAGEAPARPAQAPPPPQTISQPSPSVPSPTGSTNGFEPRELAELVRAMRASGTSTARIAQFLAALEQPALVAPAIPAAAAPSRQLTADQLDAALEAMLAAQGRNGAAARGNGATAGSSDGAAAGPNGAAARTRGAVPVGNEANAGMQEIVGRALHQLSQPGFREQAQAFARELVSRAQARGAQTASPIQVVGASALDPRVLDRLAQAARAAKGPAQGSARNPI